MFAARLAFIARASVVAWLTVAFYSLMAVWKEFTTTWYTYSINVVLILFFLLLKFKSVHRPGLELAEDTFIMRPVWVMVLAFLSCILWESWQNHWTIKGLAAFTTIMMAGLSALLCLSSLGLEMIIISSTQNMAKGRVEGTLTLAGTRRVIKYGTIVVSWVFLAVVSYNVMLVSLSIYLRKKDKHDPTVGDFVAAVAFLVPTFFVGIKLTFFPVSLWTGRIAFLLNFGVHFAINRVVSMGAEATFVYSVFIMHIVFAAKLIDNCDKLHIIKAVAACFLQAFIGFVYEQPSTWISLDEVVQGAFSLGFISSLSIFVFLCDNEERDSTLQVFGETLIMASGQLKLAPMPRVVFQV